MSATTIEPFAELRARLVGFDWAWSRENAAGIAAHWERRRAAQPKLFNGRVLMVAGARLGADGLDLDLFETDYASLLTHIDWGFPDPNVRNGFAMGALRGRDGAFVLGVMGAHTANAGRLYFPAGTPDLSDVRPDGTVDLQGSILREIGEETGLVLDPSALAPGWTLVNHAGRAALMRGVRLERDAEDVRGEVAAFIRQEGSRSELSEAVVLRSPEAIEESRMPDFLPAYLRWAFGAGPGGQAPGQG